MGARLIKVIQVIDEQQEQQDTPIWSCPKLSGIALYEILIFFLIL
jgi:hypothetical protein